MDIIKQFRSKSYTTYIIIYSLQGSPCGLSVTPSGNLLVTCRYPSKLVELNADNGQCVRETLQSDIEDPEHAVQLTTGQLVVCHGIRKDRLHRVCVVDVEGRVTCSYGGQCGSGAEPS